MSTLNIIIDIGGGKTYDYAIKYKESFIYCFCKKPLKNLPDNVIIFLNDMSDYIENKIITLDSLRLHSCNIININTNNIKKINDILRGAENTLYSLDPNIYINTYDDETIKLLDIAGYIISKKDEEYMASKLPSKSNLQE